MCKTRDAKAVDSRSGASKQFDADRRKCETEFGVGTLHLRRRVFFPVGDGITFSAATQDATAHTARINPIIASERVIGTSSQRAAIILNAPKASSTPRPHGRWRTGCI